MARNLRFTINDYSILVPWPTVTTVICLLVREFVSSILTEGVLYWADRDILIY